MAAQPAWIMFRRLRAGLLLAALASAPAAALAAPVAPPAAAAAGDIAALARSLWPEAARAGVPRPVYDAAFAGLRPDPGVAALTRRQPEFAKPIGGYLAAQVTDARIAAGRDKLARWGDPLARIAARFGVPAAIVVAVWGLETNYGASPGDKDVIRSLATLAAIGYRPELTRAELVAALTLLSDGSARREQLRGSWAGAMGQPQFMPSSFARYAVDEDGDGRRDIWGSVPDALASIANFIRQQGWQPGVPWGFEVRLPPGLDPADSRASLAQWAARGLRRADGGALPAEGGPMILFFPAGAAGPAFLVTENFTVLKTYNFSDAYVLSVGLLADRIAGGAGFVGRWPTAVPMGKPARIALQARLAALGYPVDNREGRISLALRDTIRAAQARVGLAADGNPTDELLRRLAADRIAR